DFAQRVGMGLAMLGADDARDVVLARVEEAAQFEHHLGAARGRGHGPAWEGGFRGGDGGVDLGLAARWHGGALFACGGIESGRAAAAADGLAGDQMGNDCHATCFRAVLRMSNSLSISAFSMISGGERAMTSPVV